MRYTPIANRVIIKLEFAGPFLQNNKTLIKFSTNC